MKEPETKEKRGRKSRVTPQMLDKMIEMADLGSTYYAIAKEFEMTRTTIQKHLIKAGHPCKGTESLAKKEEPIMNKYEGLKVNPAIAVDLDGEKPAKEEYGKVTPYKLTPEEVRERYGAPGEAPEKHYSPIPVNHLTKAEMAEKCAAEKTATPEPQANADKSFDEACDQVKAFVEEQTKEAPGSGIPEDAPTIEDKKIDPDYFFDVKTEDAKPAEPAMTMTEACSKLHDMFMATDPLDTAIDTVEALIKQSADRDLAVCEEIRKRYNVPA